MPDWAFGLIATGVGVMITIVTHLGTTIWWMSKTNTKLDFLVEGRNKQIEVNESIWSRLDEHGRDISVLKERTSKL